MQDQNQFYQQNNIISTPNSDSDIISTSTSNKSRKKVALFSICAIVVIVIVVGTVLAVNLISKNDLRAKIDNLDREISELSQKESDIFFESGFTDEYFDVASEKTRKQLEKETLEEQL